jgi:hypothetical protein
MPRGFQGQLCVYCHTRPSTKTGDHVIASGFMEGTRWTVENPPIRVPACEECQKEYHDAEQYFMTVLPLDIHSAHPTARKVAEGQVTRSLDKAPWIWKPIRDNARPINLRTRSGLYIGQSAEITPREDWFDLVLKKITKGLYYHCMHERLPLHYDIGVLFLESRDHADQIWKEMERKVYNGPFQVGDSIFEFAYQYSDTDQAHTAWLISFYHGHFFYVVTAPPRTPGDVLMFPDNGQPTRYILLERTEEETTLCCAAEDTEGKICRSPNIVKLQRSSLLAAFPIVDRINLKGAPSEENTLYNTNTTKGPT